MLKEEPLMKDMRKIVRRQQARLLTTMENRGTLCRSSREDIIRSYRYTLEDIIRKIQEYDYDGE